MTIHKSQDLNASSYLIDIGNSIITQGQGYEALSRNKFKFASCNKF